LKQKSNNQAKRRLFNTSFQSQLFLIILAVFTLFVISEYLIIVYSFRGRYIKSEIQDDNGLVSSFLVELNGAKDNGGNILETQEKFVNSGASLLLLSNKSGGFKIIDSVNTKYEVEISYSGSTYKVSPPSYSVFLKEGDVVDAIIKEDSESIYSFVTLTINGSKTINSDDRNSSYIEITGGIITKVTKPENLNFIYEKLNSTISGLNAISDNLSNFEKVKTNSSSPYTVGYYYLDNTNSTLYCLYQPKSYDGDVFVFATFSLVRTSSILSIVSLYYGYIVLISIIISVLIALFISRAFSTPVKQIEKEMINLTENNYEPSSYNFKNREMISLQNTLNVIKKDTEEKVESINSQKEDLERINDELRNESDLRSSFIARLSHELKTPLMVISATTEALEDGIIPEDEIKDNYETILGEVDKTTGIIKDIIGTYKTSQKKEAKLNYTRFNLSEAVEEILNPLLPLSQKKNLNVVVNLNDKVYINADKELISQVISNYITNAFKYTDDDEKVEINVLENKDYYSFEVKNYGSHIDSENLSKIWLPFYRENEDIDKTSTGMGLYIVKEILTSHKYEYDVTNFDDGVISYFKVKK